MPDDEAMAAQRKTAQFIAEAMNEKLARTPDPRDEVIRRLMEALTFYADANNYEGASLTDPCGCCSTWHEPPIHETTDNGNTARDALTFAREQLR